MAVTADKVVVELELKDGQYLAKVRQAESQFNRSQDSMGRAAENTERRIKSSSAAISASLARMAGAIAATASVGAIIRMGDAYTNMQNRLKAAGLEGKELIRVENELYDAANRNGIAIDAVASLYQRASLAQKSLGASNQEIIDLTNGVSAALRVQGVSASQASGPLLQLGQALGAGTVRAEELNSLLEGTPLIIQAAANGSDRFKGNMNALSAAIRDGTVSSQELFRALQKGLPEVEKKAATLPKTVGQAMEILNNQLGRYVGQADQGLSATARLAQGIESLANNLDTIVPVLATIAAYFGLRLAGSIAVTTAAMGANALATARLIGFQIAMTASLTGATRAQVALNAAMAANPIGFVATAVTALVAGLGYLIISYNNAAVAARDLNAVQNASADATNKYREAVLKAAQASGKQREELLKVANAHREVAAAALYELAIEARRQRQAAQAAKQRAAEADLAANRYRSESSGAGFSNSRAANVGGMDARARGAAEYARKAEEAAVIAEAAANEGFNALLDAQNASQQAVSLTGVEDKNKKKDKDSKDRRAETIANLKEQLGIEEAQLQGNEALVRSLEQQAEERARIKQLVDAGFSQGQAEIYNEEIKAKLIAARAVESDRIRQSDLAQHSLTLAQINGEIEIVRQLEREAELNELIEKHKKTTLSTEEAITAANKEQRELNDARAFAAGQYLDTVQKTHSLRIAEILGDKERVKLLTDQEEIVRRTNELRAQGLLSESEARKMAKGQVTAERAATEYASQREFFASTFSEGLRAAMAGDLKGFLSSQFGNIADQAFRKLGETLFDSFMNVPADIATAQIEGAAQGVAAGTAISTAMITSSVTAGSTIGGAMTAAGLAVAKAIAAAMAAGSGSSTASSIFSAFSGNRAGGGPVKAGAAYTVGESGRETFVPSQNGYIIPNMQNVRANAGAPSMVKLIVDEGSMFQARVEQISGPIAVQAAVTSTSYSNTQAKTSQRRRSQSFV